MRYDNLSGDYPKAGEHAILTPSPTGAGPHTFGHLIGPLSPPSRRSPEETPELLMPCNSDRNKPVKDLRKDMSRCRCTALTRVLIHRNERVNPVCAKSWSEYPHTRTVLATSACLLTSLPTQESDMRHLEIEVQAPDLNWHASATSACARTWSRRSCLPSDQARGRDTLTPQRGGYFQSAQGHPSNSPRGNLIRHVRPPFSHAKITHKRCQIRHHHSQCRRAHGY